MHRDTIYKRKLTSMERPRLASNHHLYLHMSEHAPIYLHYPSSSHSLHCQNIDHHQVNTTQYHIWITRSLSTYGWWSTKTCLQKRKEAVRNLCMILDLLFSNMELHQLPPLRTCSYDSLSCSFCMIAPVAILPLVPCDINQQFLLHIVKNTLYSRP